MAHIPKEKREARMRRKHLEDPDIQAVPGWPYGTPKPRIKMTDHGEYSSYVILWNGHECWSGDASRFGNALAAAQRNRIWIMKAILKGRWGGIPGYQSTQDVSQEPKARLKLKPKE